MLRALLYDFDGTLVDSAEVSYRCYLRVFTHLGIPFDRRRFEETYSPDWYQTYRALGLDEELWPDADRRWVECYAGEASPLVDGARETLLRVRDAGLAQALVTSGSRERVRRELERHALGELLHPVVCSEDVRRKKPHPEGLESALAALGIAAGEAAYVGDSPEDVEMARAAGVRAVAIPGGFPNRDALRASPWDVLAGSLDEAVGRCLEGGF